MTRGRRKLSATRGRRKVTRGRRKLSGVTRQRTCPVNLLSRGKNEKGIQPGQRDQFSRLQKHFVKDIHSTNACILSEVGV